MQNNDHDKKKRSSEILSFSPVPEEDRAHFFLYSEQSKNTPQKNHKNVIKVKHDGQICIQETTKRTNDTPASILLLPALPAVMGGASGCR